MTILARFTKQPSEVSDYTVDFSEWFSNRTDTPVSFTVAADTGITIAASSRNGNVVRVVLSGGADGNSYKVTVLLTTNASPAIVKEADFVVKVREY